MGNFVAGLSEMQAALLELGKQSPERIAKSVLNAGASVFAKAMKKEAPIGETKAVRDSIGKRLEKNKKTGMYTAKVGVNVGKQKKGQVGRTAPHGHLVVLGTRQRTRRSLGGKFARIIHPTSKQLNTGVMPANHFVQRAYDKSRAAALAAMQKRFEKKLAEEVAKARR